MAEFYQLALGDVHQIAAAHGRGVTQLLTLALTPHIEALGQSQEDDEENDEFASDEFEFDESTIDAPLESDKIKLAIIGKPNVGKSTLTNRILGEERVVVYDMPGTTETAFIFQWSVTNVNIR